MAVIVFVGMLLLSLSLLALTLAEHYYKGRPKAEYELLDEIYEILSVSEKQKNEKGDYYLIVLKNSASGDERLIQMSEIPPKIFHNVNGKHYPFPDPTK